MLSRGNSELTPGYQGRGNLVYEPLAPLSLTQRLGRLRLACYQFTAGLITALVILLNLLLAQAYWPGWTGSLIAAAVAVLAMIYQLGLLVRRLHDMDKSGFWILLSLVPVINIFFYLYLYLGEGSGAMNRFGTPNPPPGVLVLSIGGLCWFINVATMLAMVLLMAMLWFTPEWLSGWGTALSLDPVGIQEQMRWLSR